MKNRILGLVFCLFVALFLLPTVADADSIDGVISTNSNWNGGDVVSETVNITGGTEESPIIITVNGTITLKYGINVSSGYVKFTGGGTLLRDTTNNYSSMLTVNGGTAILDAVTIDGNSVSCAGYYGVYGNGGDVVMNENSCIKNHVSSTRKGSAVYVGANSDFVMNSGLICDNKVKSYGAIYLDDSSSFTMWDGTISRNEVTSTTEYGGGALYLRRAILTIKGGRITENHSTNKGGAIYISSYGTTIITGGYISGNTATYGKGIYYSSRQGGEAVLKIGGDAEINDDIYLDGATEAKHAFLISALQHRIFLTASDTTVGTVIAAGGDGYSITNEDMSKIMLLNEGDNYLCLDNNKISITDSVTMFLGYDAKGGIDAPESRVLTGVLPIETIISNNSPRKEGYSFIEWNTEPNGTGESFSQGDPIDISENTTLYAQWVGIRNFSSLTANGSSSDTTTELTLTFDKDIAGLSASDITVTGASKGTLTKQTGAGVYKLTISDITVADQGTVNVAVAKNGFVITPTNKDVTVRVITDESVAFSSLTANGSSSDTTTELTLTFDKDITGLSANDITVTGASKGTLTKQTGTGVYKLTISDITVADQETVNVAVAKNGFTITPTNKDVTVRVITDESVAFSNLTANGSSSDTTTELTLTFDRDITGLSANDITVTGASKGRLTKQTGTGVYKLTISDIRVADQETVNVAVAKNGFIITPTNKDVTVRKVSIDSGMGSSISNNDGNTGSNKEPAEITIPPAPVTPNIIQYSIIKGQGSKWVKGNSNTLKLTFNADYSKFSGVLVDGMVITSDDYTFESGSASITLKESYLKRISNGQHALRVNFTDGYAETSFSVKATKASKKATTKTAKKEAKKTNKKLTVPATGDDSRQILWLAIVLMGGTGFAAGLVLQRKRGIGEIHETRTWNC